METAATATILQALTDPVLLIDGEKTIVTANDAAKNLLGAQIEGRTADVHIRRLRKALDISSSKDIIRTGRGSGYSIDGDA